MVNNKIIGENLRALRDGAGYNQQSIADFLAVDQSLISKIEKGERGISVDMLDKLASLFGVAASAVVNDVVAVKPLSCAFRCGELSPGDMEAICAINKIALNLEFMDSLLEGNRA
ncbi:MAG TPA: helix-turn-helix transcriptional regulator [Candidatus Acidoferrum sp.]|nr:helix-turn-helix transcriptional regulator [Candidatus Acidoferrum sp.]